MTQFNFSEVEGIEPEQPQESLSCTSNFNVQASSPRSALDLEGAKRAFEPYKRRISEMQQQADALEIRDDSGEKQAVDAAAQAKKLVNALEDQRKSVIADPDKFVRSVNSFVRTFRQPLDNVVNTLRLKIGTFQYEKELERRKIQKAMEEEARKLQEKLDAEAKEAGIELPPVMPVPAPRPDSITRTEAGASASIRTQWTGEIIEPGKVPREYCSPDQSKISQAVKAGVRQIPGVKIFEKPITVLRS